MNQLYDTIGVDYARLRRPDHRIETAIREALGAAASVVNVGAGAGSYEPRDLAVVAVEPSLEMILQRPDTAAPVVQAWAQDLPFPDDAFDAAMAVLTVHHWQDKEQGFAELRRVARKQIVVLTYDPAFRGFWLTDYFPELITLDEGQMPDLVDYQRWLGEVDVTPVLIPHDCTDGFLCAYWRRPAAYLDPAIRAAISSFWSLPDLSAGLERLARDLESGAWQARYGDLLDRDELDCGYRLVTSR